MVNFFTKFLLIVYKISFNTLIIFFNTSVFVLTTTLGLVEFFLKIFFEKIKPYRKNIDNFFVFCINKLLFIFCTIPWWFFCEFLKPFYKKYLSNKIISISLFINLPVLINFFFKTLQGVLKFFKIFLWKVWKIIIDFFFFKILRNKKKIFNYMYKTYYCVVVLTLSTLILYFFFYKNALVLFHDFFFSNFKENYVVLDFCSTTGVFYIIMSLFNLNNVFVYTLSLNKTLFFSSFSFNDFYMVYGANWIDYFFEYNLLGYNTQIFKNYFDSVYVILHNMYFTFAPVDLSSTPVFFFFGLFFFTGVLLSWVFFSYLGLYGIFLLNLTTLFTFWVSLLFYFKSIFFFQKVFLIKLCSWIFLSAGVKIDYYFLFDTVSYSFILLTTTIALFVFIYAFSYFRYEPLVDRFLLFIVSFVVSMIFLVSSGNTVMLFLGWELIGLTSFFLINFWTTKTATLKSAFKAFTFNKVSDFFLFMFILSTYSMFNTFDILSLNNQIVFYEYFSIFFLGVQISCVEFLAVMVIGAAFIKSAQLGGHAWLPDSMEAPVPASALIHSATLVSAGVYLILRFNSFFDVTHIAKYIIPTVGSLTAAYGGVCALAQSDIKKTLAYSTISHCGFLMVLCSTEMNEFTILYLYVHGFFKAGVFMCIGNVLRISRGYQDTRRMGGLLKYLPFEYFCATIGVLNLAGLPFTFGFFIKHLLLISVNNNLFIHYFVLTNCLIGAISGLFYSYKIITFIFIDFKKGNKTLYLNSNRQGYGSMFYTNSSLAATVAIFGLFLSAYIILYFLYKYLLSSNCLFSDYLNTTILTSYFLVMDASHGFLINFSHLNLFVVSVLLYFLFSVFRKIQNNTQNYKNIFILFTIVVTGVLCFYII